MSTSIDSAPGGEQFGASSTRPSVARYEERIRRTLILTALYTIPVYVATVSLAVTDADLWWHLRIGQWIVEHAAVPAVDSFSAYGMGKPFVAYSWLFEVLIYEVYRAGGLTGIVFFNTTMAMLIAVALHALVRSLEPRFAAAALLTGICLGTIPFMPRPWLFTILFLIIELHILLTVRRRGSGGGNATRRLWLLPLLFVLWANIHIQFIYGLFVLGLVAAEPLLDRVLRRFALFDAGESIPARQLWPVAAACGVATLVTPYHLKLYYVVYEIIRQTGVYAYISELQSLSFRIPSDWFVLGLTLGAALVLGRRGKIRPIFAMLLLAACYVSFRAMRDAWFVAIVAITIIASSQPRAAAAAALSRHVLTKGQRGAVALGVVLFLLVVVHGNKISEIELEKVLARSFPAAAIDYIETHQLPGPIYNHFNWGGYLIWRAPRLPVAMDGRSNVHGDERIERSVATWTGKSNWSTDPELAAANLVVADINQSLSSLLRLDPRFELVYEDKVATVFVKRK